MKSLITLAVSGVVLSSCSVYRSGQTPDDVYYSPAPRQTAAYVQADDGRDDGKRYNNRNNRSNYGYDDYATADDRWLMMRVRNRSRWSMFDDYNYYSPYNTWGWGGFHPGMSMGYGYYSPYHYSYSYNHFNDYWYWNSYYNPYYSNVIVINPKTNPAGYTRIRNFNLNTYNNAGYNNRRTINNRPQFNSNQRYNNTNSNRRVYSNSSDTRNDSYSRPSQDRPVRTYNPSNNSSSSPRSSGSTGSGSGSSNSGSRPNRR